MIRRLLLSSSPSGIEMAYGLTRISADLRHHGAFQVAEDIALRSVNRVMFLKVLHCMKLESACPEYLYTPANYTAGFLDYAQLSKLAGQPELELSKEFLDKAFRKGDRCYGFMHNNVLAAYQWYSTQPTGTDWRGMIASFDNEYVYMYKGFTHSGHRGRRLYPSGVTAALSHYRNRGYRGLLSIVESNNFASLKSCYRMGYVDIGKIRVASLFDRCLLHADPSCNEYRLRLTRKN